MKRALFAVFALVVVGCSSGLLAPDSVRQAEFLEKVRVKRGTAYQQALRWTDKNLRFVPDAPRIQEPDRGHMRMEAAYACNSLRKDNDLKDYFLTFELDFSASTGSIHLHFTQLRMENLDGMLITKPEVQLSSPSNVEKIRPCLKKMVSSIVKAVESNKVNW